MSDEPYTLLPPERQMSQEQMSITFDSRDELLHQLCIKAFGAPPIFMADVVTLRRALQGMLDDRPRAREIAREILTDTKS